MSIEKSKVARQEFAKRLQLACEQCDACPTEQPRGKQKWLYEALDKQFGTKVSPEATRKWFAGESAPRQPTIRQIAKILNVDFAWLAVGTKPDMTEQEKRQHNLKVSGAVNVVAGIIQSNGGSVSFAGGERDELTAIIEGGLYVIEIRSPIIEDAEEGTYRITPKINTNTLLCVIPGIPLGRMTILHIPSDVVREQGENRGGYWEVEIRNDGKNYLIGNTRLHEVITMGDLMNIATNYT